MFSIFKTLSHMFAPAEWHHWNVLQTAGRTPQERRARSVALSSQIYPLSSGLTLVYLSRPTPCGARAEWRSGRIVAVRWSTPSSSAARRRVLHFATDAR